MNFKQAVEEQLEKAKALRERLQEIYRQAYDRALSVGREGASELTRVREAVEPKVRLTVDSGLQKAQALFDEFNQALAEKAVPPFRKAGVTQQRLQEKTIGVQKGSLSTIKPAPAKRTAPGKSVGVATKQGQGEQPSPKKPRMKPKGAGRSAAGAAAKAVAKKSERSATARPSGAKAGGKRSTAKAKPKTADARGD